MVDLLLLIPIQHHIVEDTAVDELLIQHICPIIVHEYI